MLLICPLLKAVIPPDPAACKQERCAWWDEEKNCCSIKVIAKELSRIQIGEKEV